MIFDLDAKDIDAIAEAVAQRLQPERRTHWLTRQEAAVHLRMSTKHLDKLVKVGDIEVYRPSEGKPLFCRAELDAFVRERRAS